MGPTGSFIPNFLSFVGGFATAVLAEPLRQRLFASKVLLSFDQTTDCIAVTDALLNGQPCRARYVRLRVRNQSFRLAKACRVYLVNIERLDRDGRYQRTIYCDSIQLAWSVRPDAQFSGVDIPKEVPCFVDLFATYETETRFFPQLLHIPFRYEELLKDRGTFRYTVRISGDGVRPATLTLNHSWQGQWDRIDVTAA